MKNFLEIIFTTFALICSVDLIYEKLNSTWFFDFDWNSSQQLNFISTPNGRFNQKKYV